MKVYEILQFSFGLVLLFYTFIEFDAATDYCDFSKKCSSII